MPDIYLFMPDIYAGYLCRILRRIFIIIRLTTSAPHALSQPHPTLPTTHLVTMSPRIHHTRSSSSRNCPTVLTPLTLQLHVLPTQPPPLQPTHRCGISLINPGHPLRFPVTSPTTRRVTMYGFITSFPATAFPLLLARARHPYHR